MSHTSENAPPIEVQAEFLQALHEHVDSHDRIVPVLRGSVLLQHWFGEAARPAADIDLEWFPDPAWCTSGRFASPIEHARRLCMNAIVEHGGSPIVFDEEMPVPTDGASLWEYDTPGVRCYTGWRWDDRSLCGVLQVDLALSSSYELAAVGPEAVALPRVSGKTTSFMAYTPEMLLAAKLSWIVRNVQRSKATDNRLAFRGESKDLFDSYLLLTEGRIRPDIFQNALLAVAMGDKIEWAQVELLFEPGLALTQEDETSNWRAFLKLYSHLIHQSRDEMLRTVIARLRSLIDHIRPHLPFLRMIQDDPVDEASLLVYSDWLEDQADPRSDFLRHYCRFYFRGDKSARRKAAFALPNQPAAWLCCIFGGPERSREIRRQLDSEELESPRGTRPGAPTEPDVRPGKRWWQFWK